MLRCVAFPSVVLRSLVLILEVLRLIYWEDLCSFTGVCVLAFFFFVLPSIGLIANCVAFSFVPLMCCDVLLPVVFLSNCVVFIFVMFLCC